MKRKQEQNCVPLQIVRNLTRQVPDIWERVEKIRAEKKSNWPEWCYIPTREGVDIAFDLCGRDALDSSYYGQQISTLAPWRLSKEIFLIDPQLEEELCKQENLNIPAECLMKLPYPCFYVKFQGDTMKSFLYDGVFVRLDADPSRGNELKLLFASADGRTTGFPISLEAKTVTESFKKVVELAYANLQRIRDEAAVKRLSEKVRQYVEDSTAELLQKTLQLVLYLCAENAELVPEPSATGRETTSALKDVVTRKDRYSDIRKWDVGVRIGAAIRKYRSEAKTENPESLDEEVKSETKERTGHASPRPHMRRGHWHHFWTGAKKDVEGRKLVLRWIPPTFIGKEMATPVVLHYESETRTK